MLNSRQKAAIETKSIISIKKAPIPLRTTPPIPRAKAGIGLLPVDLLKRRMDLMPKMKEITSIGAPKKVITKEVTRAAS